MSLSSGIFFSQLQAEDLKLVYTPKILVKQHDYCPGLLPTCRHNIHEFVHESRLT